MPRATDELTPDEDPLDGNEQIPLEMHMPEEEEPAAEGDPESSESNS
jgi:hypothetical protein